jgi:acyl-homoserine-lactone acylase
MPHVIREDYVANSNDSFWLANPRSPTTGFSPVIGAVDVVQNLRTRAGILEIEAALKSGGKMTPQQAETMLLGNRNLAAELYLDDVLSMCRAAPMATSSTGESVDLTRPCAVLAAWDRHMDLDSRGAHLFNEFWKLTDRLKLAYTVPFDKTDPVHTPRGLVTEPGAAKPVLTALADAVLLINKRGVALDARWGDLAVARRGNVRVPLHGGEGGQGVLNAHQSEWTDGVGYLTNSGSSYIQIVRFDDKGPVVDAVLTYAQSTDPASPHATDQTKVYSQKKWIRLPFHRRDIDAAKDKSRLVIEE